MSAGNDAALAASVEREDYVFFDKPLDVTTLIQSIKTLLHRKEKE